MTQNNPFGPDFENAHFSRLHQDAELIKTFVNWRDSKANILFWGAKKTGQNIGNGKTYFCAALWNFLKEHNANVRAFNENDYYSAVKEVISRGWDYNEHAKRLCEIKWLIIDDLGSSKITDFTKECIYTLVDTRLNNNLPTLITSNLTLDDIKEIYTPRVHSRITAIKNTVVLTNEEDRRQQKFD